MKKIIVVISVIFAILLLTLAVGAAEVTVEAPDKRQFEATSYNFYLPSYISPSSVKLVHNSSKTLTYVTANGTREPLPSGTVVDLTPFKVTAPSGQEMYMLNVIVNGMSTKTFYFSFANNLPSVHVETSIGWETLVSTNGKDTASGVTVINKDGTYEYIDSTNGSQIKVRGNATKAYAKKPFQIKLETKADLFGMGDVSDSQGPVRKLPAHSAFPDL